MRWSHFIYNFQNVRPRILILHLSSWYFFDHSRLSGWSGGQGGQVGQNGRAFLGREGGQVGHFFFTKGKTSRKKNTFSSSFRALAKLILTLFKQCTSVNIAQIVDRFGAQMANGMWKCQFAQWNQGTDSNFVKSFTQPGRGDGCLDQQFA